MRWIVIHCTDAQLTILKWTNEAADAPGARHYCGESHAQMLISRSFESYCLTMAGVIHCNDAQLTIYKWTREAANARGARHYCGEAHAQVYVSRWLEAACSYSIFGIAVDRKHALQVAFSSRKSHFTRSLKSLRGFRKCRNSPDQVPLFAGPVDSRTTSSGRITISAGKLLLAVGNPLQQHLRSAPAHLRRAAGARW